MATTDHSDNTLKIAVVGSGPSGFYAAEALLRADLPVQVDMLERLPTPFGLVRSGVAPDHPKLKEVIKVYDRIARNPEFRFLGNVALGEDLTVDELQANYHAIVLACGAQSDRRMGIPGEDLPGSHTATEFVGWFNGHPDYRDLAFDLDGEVAVIVGQGNVAADVCRILAKPVRELRSTDISEHALEALAQSRIREIHIVGRRGPAQARFTPRELRELGEIPDCVTLANSDDLRLGPHCETEIEDPQNGNAGKNCALFREFAANQTGDARTQVRFHFYRSPSEVLGSNRVTGLRLERNRLDGPAFAQVARPTGETTTLDCDLLFRSIGYKGVPIPGLPFDDVRGIVPNQAGRVAVNDRTVPGVYVTGWLKRGPSGVIGTNRADSVETVKHLLSDLADAPATSKPGHQGLEELLRQRRAEQVSYQQWLQIDEAEVMRGQPRGKPREKFTRVRDMLACAGRK
ncbi:FAD-dependent oxidoreductase [Methylonatrum kenyense]|uniref:FAD-dependent oxidoreductase n=1 Tax=Methylonatrum kenyense TaxID=455253 RepID=UPI0020BEFB66|nr:FAD-dependent oxidoreductase [Methylonatrum kenyense]MCK8517229.1 FAD-dependent oxidoreductase [Methylonatrum kenyense]